MLFKSRNIHDFVIDAEISIVVKRKMVKAIQANDEMNNKVIKRFFTNKVEDVENVISKNILDFINFNSLHLLRMFSSDFLVKAVLNEEVT